MNVNLRSQFFVKGVKVKKKKIEKSRKKLQRSRLVVIFIYKPREHDLSLRVKHTCSLDKCEG